MNIPKRTIALGLLAISILILSCSLEGLTGSADKIKTPTPTAIPGWEKFSGGGIELWMPESFEGGKALRPPLRGGEPRAYTSPLQPRGPGQGVPRV